MLKVETQQTMSEQPGRRKKILIVDDEPHVVTYLEALLSDHGYETVSAVDGRAGLEAAREERPDLLVLDLLMPRQTGADLYRNLVMDDVIADTPVIVLSAIPEKHLAVREPAAIFDKPIDPEAFLDAVDRILRG